MKHAFSGIAYVVIVIVFVSCISCRLLIGLIVAVLVYVTPKFVVNHNVPFFYYGILLVVYGLHQVFKILQFDKKLTLY